VRISPPPPDGRSIGEFVCTRAELTAERAPVARDDERQGVPLSSLRESMKFLLNRAKKRQRIHRYSSHRDEDHRLRMLADSRM
jgi:hypothetical protein